MRVLTLNVWNTDGPWEIRRGRIREWVRRLNPDLVGFQEVLGAGHAKDVLDGLAYNVDFARASWFWRDRSIEFGNAVASRWPLTDREELELPAVGTDETRVALSVSVDAPFGPVSFTCTHLNWKPHHGFVRERQVVALCEFVLRRRPRGGYPPVVVGDFNAEPSSAEIRYVTGLQSMEGRSVFFNDAWRVAGEGPGTTWSNSNTYAAGGRMPDRRIDYVLAGFPSSGGNGTVERCEVVCDDERDGVWPSDHFGVLADLRSP